MSKTQLKKELQHMERDQLQELIMELYEARKEAKEYLDFFVDPDIEKMTEKYRATLRKEIGRVSRGRALPRMTRVRKAVKNFSSFNPGAEYVAEMMTFAIEQLCAIVAGNWIKDATARSVARFLGETLVYIDRQEIVSIYLPRLIAAVESLPSGVFRTSYFKRSMRDTLEAFTSNLSPDVN